VRVANSILRFLLELCALAALGYWGFHAAGGAVQWLLGLGAPLAMAVVWGAFMAPKAARPLRDPIRIVAEIAIFGIAALALAVADQPGLAIAFAAAVALHLLLTFPLDQRDPTAEAF